MLAEPRVKQRLVGDPQGKAWSQDTSKFGYKMLQSMGWSEGKGLGANESGITTHVRVTKKADQLGIGAKKTTSDNWLENSSAFDSLLKNLNESIAPQTTPEEPKVEADKKEKTKVETKRNVMYRKVLKNRDSRNYGAKEMEEILCRQKVISKTKEKEEEDNEGGAADDDDRPRLGFSTQDDDKDEEDESVTGITLKKSGFSVFDYFMKKEAEASGKSNVASVASSPQKTGDVASEEEEDSEEKEQDTVKEKPKKKEKKAKKEPKAKEEKKEKKEKKAKKAKKDEDSNVSDDESKEKTKEKKSKDKKKDKAKDSPSTEKAKKAPKTEEFSKKESKKRKAEDKEDKEDKKESKSKKQKTQ